MTFNENASFPLDISVGSACNYSFGSQVLVSRTGHESRMTRWAQPLRSWNVAYGIKNQTQMMAVQDFYLGSDGAVHGFKFTDPLEYTTSADGQTAPTYLDVILGMYDGVKTEWQIFKEYRSGGHAIRMPIIKPKSSGFVVGNTGAPATITTDYTIDTTTGKLTLNDTGTNWLTGAIISFGCYFDIPAHFAEEIDREMLINIEYGNNRSLPDIPIIEESHGVVPPFEELEEPFPGGGAVNHGTESINVLITPTEGKVHYFQPTQNFRCYVESPSKYPAGGEILVITNYTDDASYRTIDVRCVDDETTSLGSITTTAALHAKGMILGVAENLTTLEKEWVVWL